MLSCCTHSSIIPQIRVRIYLDEGVNYLRKTLLTILLCPMFIIGYSLTACSSNSQVENSIVGTWKNEDIGIVVVTFNEDGTYFEEIDIHSNGFNITIEGTYLIEDDYLITRVTRMRDAEVSESVSEATSISRNFRVTGNQLIFRNDDGSDAVFIRI